jgi:hypothetical protein
MNYINPKTSSDHPGDDTVVNNGGVTVLTGAGSTPAEKVGDKATQTPTINKDVNESRL